MFWYGALLGFASSTWSVSPVSIRLAPAEACFCRGARVMCFHMAGTVRNCDIRLLCQDWLKIWKMKIKRTLKHAQVEISETLQAEHFQSCPDFFHTAVLDYSLSLSAVQRNNSKLQAYYSVMRNMSLWWAVNLDLLLLTKKAVFSYQTNGHGGAKVIHHVGIHLHWIWTQQESMQLF